jgi:hypothetical protein
MLIWKEENNDLDKNKTKTKELTCFGLKAYVHKRKFLNDFHLYYIYNCLLYMNKRRTIFYI